MGCVRSVSKYVLRLHKTYQSGILGEGGGGMGGGGGGGGQPSEKWFITMKRSFTGYENEDFTLSLKHQLYKAAFPRAKFLCHVSHALQSLLTDFCGNITVNLYSRADTDKK